jgi:hypothetical protein
MNLRTLTVVGLIAFRTLACSNSTESARPSACPPCSGNQHCMQRCVDGGAPEPVCVVESQGRQLLANGTPVDDCSGF